MNNENCFWNTAPEMAARFCEQPLCSVVIQPANTWSNIGYLIAAFFLLRQAQLNQNKYGFSFLSFVLFIGSTMYHMTGTFWGRMLDVGAMLMLSGFMLSLTITRFFKIKNAWALLIGALIFALSAPAMPVGKGSLVFLIQVLSCAFIEWAMSRRLDISPEIKKLLRRAVGLFLIALVCQRLDYHRVICDPHNHVVNLHAIWHLICAYCIFLIAQYYSSTNSVKSISSKD